MWLLKNHVEKCDKNVEQSINSEVRSIKEVSSSSSMVEVKTKSVNTLEALRERTEYVNEVFSRLETLKKKPLDNDTYTSDVDRPENYDDKLGPAYEELKQNFEINSRRLEEVLRLLPLLENQLLAVSQKVSHLTDVLDAQTAEANNLPERIDRKTDFSTSGSPKELNPTTSNVAALTPSSNRIRQSSQNSMRLKNETVTTAARKKPLKNKETLIRKCSEVHRKSPSNNYKRSSQNELKALIREVVASVAEMNRATMNKKRTREMDPDGVMDERHETISGKLAQSSFTALEFIFNHLKTSQETGKNEILAVLSKLEEKINTNKSTVETSTGVLEKNSFGGPGENIKRSQNQSNIEIENKQCHQEQHVAVEDVTKCLDDQTDVKYIREEQPRQISVNITFARDDKHNDNANEYMSKSDQCVCVSMTNENTNTQNENSRNTNAQKLNDDHNVKCLKTKSHSERTIQFSHFSQTDKINEDKVDKYTKTNSEQECISASTSFKCSNRFSNRSLNESKFSKETKCEGGICDYLRSQPAAEWIKRERESKSIENQCEKIRKTQKELSCPTKNIKLFNVEKIVNDNRDNNEIVYEITQKSRTQRTQRSKNFNGSCPQNFSS